LAEETETMTTTKQQLQLTTKQEESEELPYYCSCGKRFASWTSLRGHCAGSGHEMPAEFKKGEGRDIPKETEKTKEKKEEVSLEVEPIEEELPEERLSDKLDYLNSLLKDYGVKHRTAIIRRMALVDPLNIYELQASLDEIGVNRARQRAIISTYCRWLGVRIPSQVIQRLKPPIEEYETPSYEWGYSPEWGKRGKGEADTGSLLKGIAELIRAINPPAINSSNPETEGLRQEIDTLRQFLLERDKRIQKLEEELRKKEIETLKQEIQELKKSQGVSGGHHLSQPTVREKVPGEYTIIEELPEEYVEG